MVQNVIPATEGYLIPDQNSRVRIHGLEFIVSLKGTLNMVKKEDQHL